MNTQYFPIVRAKAGEMEALKRLDASTLARCTPIFEVTKLDGSDLERARKRSTTPFEDYLDKRAEAIAAIFKGKHVIVDASQWPVDFVTEGGEQVLGYLCSALCDLDVNVCPVIGYDRWDSIEYQETIKSMVLPEKSFFCIRLDSIAIEDFGDIDHLNDVIESMIAVTGLNEAATPVLIDVGDVTKLPIDEFMEVVETAYGHMKGLGFEFVIMSASSIPDSIEKAVKDRDSTGIVQRKEMIVWKGFMSANPSASLYFGDYGVRNPRSSDIIATHMNVKIRYTISNAFFIARGHSVQGADGYAQSQQLSRVIVNSVHYKHPPFSWGDMKIMECSLGGFTGSSTNWISFDTNHHIKMVATEILEFTTQLAAVAARV